MPVAHFRRTDPVIRRLANGSAGVNISGRRITLGPWNDDTDEASDLAKVVWSKVHAEWISRGRENMDSRTVARLKEEAREALRVNDLRTATKRIGPRYEHLGAVERNLMPPEQQKLKTIGDVFADYLKLKEHDDRHAVSPGRLREIRDALAWFGEGYGSLPAQEFDAALLDQAQLRLMATGRMNYRTINGRIFIFLAAMRHGVSRGHVDPVKLAGAERIEKLTARSRGLPKRRREKRPWNGVPDDVFEKTMGAITSPMVEHMLRILNLTGMRPGELLSMSVEHVDRSRAVWRYEPPSHKNTHRGKRRRIVIGPHAQQILGPYLDRAQPGRPVFSPIEAERMRAVARRATRKAHPSTNKTRDELNAAREDQRELRDDWDPRTLNRALVRACESAGVPKWSPGQCRHAFKNRVAWKYDLATAETMMGHRAPTIGDEYGDFDEQKMDEVASAIG